jgi:nitroimidazol reductase NimA-like FMN-containing flavoprotein (pyridoxamine 5'-phosphate oxidase superfamily)
MDTKDTEARLPLLEGIEVLGEAEALALAATVPIGRVAYSRFAMPAVHVVNFALDGRDVVFRSRKGAKFGAAVADTVVAFEIDWIDERTHSGWTVTLLGRSRLVTAGADIQRLTKLGITPWAPGAREWYIRISTQTVTGRRIGPSAPVPQGRGDAACDGPHDREAGDRGRPLEGGRAVRQVSGH